MEIFLIFVCFGLMLAVNCYVVSSKERTIKSKDDEHEQELAHWKYVATLKEDEICDLQVELESCRFALKHERAKNG